MGRPNRRRVGMGTTIDGRRVQGKREKGGPLIDNQHEKNILICCLLKWMGGRAVEGTGLENRQAREGLVGSNPTPSAIRRHSIFVFSML